MPDKFSPCCTICDEPEDDNQLLFTCPEKLKVWQHILTLETGDDLTVVELTSAVLDWNQGLASQLQSLLLTSLE
ncbi:hypothetical protein INT44_002641 [Umbelopsis vinacea]|uniref:Uncharacterized protein n=1 Tax=Umbelopsis vinacea TaxID=44442 RepID=A0A8H7U705_9FUNG|nr:hypothetical protein INT44_002641 [Umbelopsis vinacea]